MEAGPAGLNCQNDDQTATGPAAANSASERYQTIEKEIPGVCWGRVLLSEQEDEVVFCDMGSVQMTGSQEVLSYSIFLVENTGVVKWKYDLSGFRGEVAANGTHRRRELQIFLVEPSGISECGSVERHFMGYGGACSV